MLRFPLIAASNAMFVPMVVAAVLMPSITSQAAAIEEKTPGNDLRVTARTRTQALDSFEVLDGFQMQLVAHEPNVIEPIVIAYDENGQMFVAEFLKFPAKKGKSEGPDGRISLLRDIDGNGHYEHSNVFANGLAWPTGICPWQGGVFVIAAPDLWYLKDTDNDGKADVRKKLYTGFE